MLFRSRIARMFQSEKIESLDLPELEPYRTLRRPEDHERRGIFVATNAKVVTRLLATDCMILSMLMTEEWLAQLRPLIEALPERERRIIVMRFFQGMSQTQIDQVCYFVQAATANHKILAHQWDG